MIQPKKYEEPVIFKKEGKKKGQLLATSEINNSNEQTNPTFDRVQFIIIKY